MSTFLIARENGRTIPKEDKIFGINKRANRMVEVVGREGVINATVGSLLDDDGKLVILSSVVNELTHLKPEDYAAYAPIGGIPEFREAIKKAAFGNFEPSSFTEAVATPGGTGAIRNAISNYSDYGDKVLTTDWHWLPYNSIAAEIGRSIDTFKLFDEEGNFNIESFSEKVNELVNEQGNLLVMINTPAHNPTGYSCTLEDWDNIIKVMSEAVTGDKTAALLVDAAYIDFAGDEDEYRQFLPKLETLPENILPMIAYSTSKTFTSYGMRCGAIICMAQTKETADEFLRVCKYSSRSTWSNGTRASQKTIARIYDDEKLLKQVEEERAVYRDMLIKRGKAFEKAAGKAGLETVPFDAGFFVSIPCTESDAISKTLEAWGAFVVPLENGLRVSIASISEKQCRKLPEMIVSAMKQVESGR